MTPSDTMFPPLYRTEGLERLDLLDWDEVHASVQAILGDLDAAVRQKCPTAVATPGRNCARTWELFSYRTYQSSEHPEVDPLVVGVDFTRAGDAILVEGDIAGETLGDILFEAAPREVIGKLAIIEAASDIAELLAKHAGVVAAAIADPGRDAD